MDVGRVPVDGQRRSPEDVNFGGLWTGLELDTRKDRERTDQYRVGGEVPAVLASLRTLSSPSLPLVLPRRSRPGVQFLGSQLQDLPSALGYVSPNHRPATRKIIRERKKFHFSYVRKIFDSFGQVLLVSRKFYLLMIIFYCIYQTCPFADTEHSEKAQENNLFDGRPQTNIYSMQINIIMDKKEFLFISTKIFI